MRLIVGLGNPGARYRDTPHNAGFVVCDRFTERHHIAGETRKFRGRFRRGPVDDEDIGVLMPGTYMNLSGDAVAEAVRYLPIAGRDIILVFDDMDLREGCIRIRPGGGSGGHQGVQSVIDHLGSEEFPRVRVGVGRPPGERGATNHLLGPVRAEERRRFLQTVELAVDALDTILREGVDEAMNRYNGLLAIGQEEEEEKKA